MHLKKLLAGFFLIGCVVSASGQSNECDQTLNQASEEFNAGHFYGIPSLLKPCLEKNAYSDEQKVRVYLLLCQAYLIIDDPIAAEDSYLKLLKADPEYVATDDKDPIDVVFLSKKFTSTPIFTPRVRIGANTSIYRSIYQVSTGSAQNNEKVKHILKPGFQIGAGVDWNINDNFSLCVDAILAYKSYKTEITGINKDDKLDVTENQYWVDIPLYLRYTYNKGKIRPFAYAGVAGNFLLSTHDLMTFTNISPSEGSESLSTGPDVKLSYMRRKISKSLVFGGGINYKIGKDFLFADLRYMAGLSNLSINTYGVDPSSKPNNPAGTVITNNLNSQYVYADSKFRLDYLSISVGYVRPLYNPRKIKHARGVGSVSRNIKKKSKNESK